MDSEAITVVKLPPAGPRSTKASYLVTLEAPDTGPAAVRRLRAFLKCALRSFRLRAVHVEQIEAPRWR